MGYNGSVSVEILAILCGLKLAWKSGHKKVILESDCTEAIDVVLGSSIGNRKDRMLIQECKELLSRMIVEIKHIWRGANRIADWIAKWAAHKGLRVLEMNNHS